MCRRLLLTICRESANNLSSEPRLPHTILYTQLPRTDITKLNSHSFFHFIFDSFMLFAIISHHKISDILFSFSASLSISLSLSFENCWILLIRMESASELRETEREYVSQCQLASLNGSTIQWSMNRQFWCSICLLSYASCSFLLISFRFVSFLPTRLPIQLNYFFSFY